MVDTPSPRSGAGVPNPNAELVALAKDLRAKYDDWHKRECDGDIPTSVLRDVRALINAALRSPDPTP